MMTISWQALAAIVAILPIMGGLFSYSLGLRFRAELAEFLNKLIADLDNKYMLKEDAERRLAMLALDLKETRHGLRNEFMRFTADIARERALDRREGRHQD